MKINPQQAESWVGDHASSHHTGNRHQVTGERGCYEEAKKQAAIAGGGYEPMRIDGIRSCLIS